MLPIVLYATAIFVFGMNFLLSCVIMMRVSDSNTESCLFSAHALLIATMNSLACVYYVTTSPYSNVDIAITGNYHWGLAVFFGLSRHLSMIAFAVSRIVSLTFTRRMQDTVWSTQVFVFCLFITLLLPLGLVISFIFDDPRIRIDRNGTITWGVAQIQDFYVQSGYAIYGVSVGSCTTGLLLAILRTKFPACMGVSSAGRRMSNGDMPIDTFQDDVDDFSSEHNIGYGVITIILLLVHTVEFAVAKEMALLYDTLSFSLTMATSVALPLCLLALWRWTTMKSELLYSNDPFYRGIRFIRKRLRSILCRRRLNANENPISFIYNVQHQRVSAMIR